MIKILHAAEMSFSRELGTFQKNESLRVGQLLSRHQEMTAELVAAVEASKGAEPSVPRDPDEDEIAVWVTEQFAGKVGPPFTDDIAKKVFAEGAKRFADRKPPGYEDAKKPEPERFGDLVLWKQLLQHARAESRSVLFVTDDSKEDWWWRVDGETIGPRPELVNECVTETSHRVYFYSPKDFLRYAQGQLETDVSKATYDEVESISENQQRQHDRVDRLLDIELIRSQIYDIENRLSSTVSALPYISRRIQLEDRLAQLERSKKRLTDAMNAAPDQDAEEAVIDSLIEVQNEMDFLVEELDSDRNSASSDRDALAHRLLALKKAYAAATAEREARG